MDALYARSDIAESLGLPTWPAASRATVDAHVRTAMISAERLHERLPVHPLDPSTLGRWSKGASAVGDDDHTPLMEAVRKRWTVT